MLRRDFISCLLATVLSLSHWSRLSCHAIANPKPKTYNYFAFGSNMASSTMINLRNLSPLASTAAVLPGHALRFNIPGVAGVEPSSAAIEPTDAVNSGALGMGGGAAVADADQVVHGVLYKLTEGDFATVCRTEGVPFAYSLHRCRAVPYDGDGKTAGGDTMRRVMPMVTERRDDTNATPSGGKDWGVPAFTLRAARKGWREGVDIPPSKSYLNLLIRGAKEFALDESFVERLESVQVGRTWLGNGLAEEMLSAAERRKRKT